MHLKENLINLLGSNNYSKKVLNQSKKITKKFGKTDLKRIRIK